MNDGQVSEFLKSNVGLFADFPEDRLEQLVSGSRVVSYEPNEAVIEFGEDALFLGVLLDGEITVSVISNSGKQQLLGS